MVLHASCTFFRHRVAGDGRWVKVNALQTGFFRVKYSEPLLRALQPALLSLTLRPSDRLGCEHKPMPSPTHPHRVITLWLIRLRLRLLDDAFALCKAGHMSTPQLLALLQSYVNENSFPVWASLTTVRRLYWPLAGIAVRLTDRPLILPPPPPPFS